MSEEKKDVWDIHVSAQRVLRVVFPEPLTMEEALDAYTNDEFEDILDEQTVSEEVSDYAE